MASAVGRGKPLQSASAIVAITESGQHLLKIGGYSCTKDVPTGSDIRSGSFFVGGHCWHILYYPNGVNSTWSDYISIYLQLDYNVPQGVKAQYTFSLLDHRGKPVPQYTRSSGVQIFRGYGWGFNAFIKRDELEKSDHLNDDCLTIRCDFTVIKEIQTKDIDVDGAIPAVVVPPSDLHRHLGGLLATGEGADVTFDVAGKTFAAHRCVLAARSPVFHADVISSALTKDESATTEGGTVVVLIKDMEAQAFEALLHYMYTDSLPETKGKTAAAMLPDLVAAANRYKMERLRLVCEEKLCEFVNAKTVAVILAFAGKHQCHGLKKACLQFLKDPANLREVVKSNGFEHLKESSPSVLKDLIA